MSHYLDKFRSSLPTTQGKQVLSILQQKKDSGEIKTVEEFKAQLQKLTELLLSKEITPTIKLFLGKAGSVINAESYNFMLARAKDDLVAAFSEFQTIEEVLDSHNQIVNEVTLRTIQLAVNDISERITLYEFINSNSVGFNKGQFNTFSTAKAAAVSKKSSLGTLLYQGIDPGQSAVIDTIGERLTLGYGNNSYNVIQGVEQVFDAEVSASEIDVRFLDSKIQNIIDGKNNTYWIYNTLLNTPRSSGVVHKIQLDLAGVQDINFIEIEPACPYPMVLDKVLYIGQDSLTVDTNIVPVTITKPTRVNLGKITADKILLKFIQYNYVETQFEEKKLDNNFYDLLSGSLITDVNMDNISEHLRDNLTSDFQLDGLLGIPRIPEAVPQHKLYQYLVGFDNIRTGYSEYSDKSYFISQPLTVENPGMIGLRVKETRPLITPSSDAEENYVGSFEYEVVKENFDSNDRFINAQRFPIAPYGLVDVTHERLQLTAKISNNPINNAGILRFWPDVAAYEPKVYRNGTLLLGPSNGSPEWTYESSLSQSSSIVSNRMVQGIKITTPLVSDIYTVTYKIKTGNTAQVPSSGTMGLGTNLFNMVNMGDASRVRVIRDNVIVTDMNLPSTNIAKSNIYLIITIRRNSSFVHLSPGLEEYMLVSVNAEKDKFESGLNE